MTFLFINYYYIELIPVCDTSLCDKVCQ